MSEMQNGDALSTSHFPRPIQISSASFLPFLDISPDALVITNQAGTIAMVNEQATGLFGYPREELLGQQLEVLLPHRFHEIHATHREHYFSAPHTRPMGVGLELFGQRKDGTEFPVDISLRPVVLDGMLHVIEAIRDMTEQRLVEHERLLLSQNLHLQSKLIHLAHDAILVRDPISRVLSWNRGAEELYGWSAQEALGRISHILLKTRSPISRAVIDMYLKQQEHWEGELTHTCRDGSTVIVESRQVLVRNEGGQPPAILEINRDITKRRHMEHVEQAVHREIAERLTFLQQVLDALPSSVYLVYGTDARLLLANDATCHIWGAHWPTDQPMLEFLKNNGIEILDTRGHPLAPAQFATLRAVQKGETVFHHQEAIRYPNGSTLPVLVNAVRLAWPYTQQRQERSKEVPLEEPAALVVHQDVTVLKEAEYLKDEFICIATHELRTPLTVLMGYTDLLLAQAAREHELTDRQKNTLSNIKKATLHLSTLMGDLLDVTRIQADHLVLQPTPTNIIPLVKRVAADLQQTTTQHHIEVRTMDSSLMVAIDTQRVEQVLINLINNSIKYSPQGGPIIVSIREEPPLQIAQISVQDTGIGIPKDQQMQIFGRFTRARNALALKIGGTGLGLYLCRELVERQGGHLWFESEEGRGSTFFITFPLISALQTASESSS